MKSPVYWHPAVYHYLMRLLYGKYFEARYEAISNLIPEHASVTEVCSGDSYLFRNYLIKKNVKYLGLDLNPSFVKYGREKNIHILKHDLLTDEVPFSDYIIIQASLYQFIPKEHYILNKLLSAANRYLIVAEPVKNLADSSNPIISFLARYSVNPGTSPAVKRFNRETLLACFKQHSEFSEVIEVDGGREIIGLFKK